MIHRFLPKPDWSALFGYDIFISYKRDEASGLATALARDLAKRDFTCFLDRTEAPPGVHLTPHIRRALRRSKVLIVIVTPGALASPWVTQEISEFRQHPSRSVIPIDVDQAFVHLDADSTPWGELRGVEPIWLDVTGDELRSVEPDPKLTQGIVRLFAYRRANTVRRIVTATVAVLLTVMAVVAIQNVREARQSARTASARKLAAQAGLVRSADPTLLEVSTLLALESMRQETLRENYQSVREALALLAKPVAQVTHKDRVTVVTFSPTGRYFATGSWDGTVQLFETATWKNLYSRELTRDDSVNSVAFSPDERYLAAGGDTGSVSVYEAASGKVEYELSKTGAVKSVAFSPNGRLLALGGSDVYVFDTISRRPLSVFTPSGTVMAFTKDSRYLATAGNDRTAGVFEAETGRLVRKLDHPEKVNAVAVSPDGRYLATGSDDNAGRVFEIATGNETARLIHLSPVIAIVFSPDGRRVATGSRDGIVRVFDVSNSAEVSRLAHAAQVGAIAFSPDGRRLATASWDRTGRVFDVRNGQEVSRVIHETGVTTVAFSPDGRYVATGSWGTNPDPILDRREEKMRRATTRVIEVPLATISITPDDTAYAVAFSPDRRYVATGNLGGTAQVFETATGRLVLRLKHEAGVTGIVFSPDGRFLTTGSMDKTTRVFEVASGQELSRVAHDDKIYAVALSPDSRYMAAGSGDGVATVFDTSTWKPVASVAHSAEVTALAFSSDGRYVASGSWDHTTRVFRAANGHLVSSMAGSERVVAVAFSPDGRYVAAGGFDKTVHVFETSSGREISQLTFEDTITAVAFSPDGRFVVAGSADNTTRVVDAMSGKEWLRLTHEGPTRAIAFDPDGRLTIASGNPQISIAHHLVDSKALTDEACGRLTRNLTLQEWRQYVGQDRYQKTCPELR